MSNSDDLLSRLCTSFRPEYEKFMADCMRSLQPHVESPIELLLGAAILAQEGLTIGRYGGIAAVSVEEYPTWPSRDDVLIPQYEIERVGRVDFLLIKQFYVLHRVVIECDGHDFHERTKEQAQRDRARDREIQRLGYQVLRFTGSEIYRNPLICADQIGTFINDRDNLALEGRKR